MYRIIKYNEQCLCEEVDSIVEDWREMNPIINNGEIIIFTDDIDYAKEQLNLTNIKIIENEMD